MTRYAHKIDINQPAIVAALRKEGFSVAITSALGDGFPDIVAGKDGANYLLEIKNGNGDLTDKEEKFSASWNGQYAIVRNVEEAYAACGVPEWRPPF